MNYLNVVFFLYDMYEEDKLMIFYLMKLVDVDVIYVLLL